MSAQVAIAVNDGMTNNPMNGAPAKAAAPAKAGMAAWKIAALAGFAGLTVAAVVVGASVYYGYEKTHTEKEVEVVVPEWGRFEIDETGALWTYEKEGVNGPAHWGTYLNATAGTPYYPTCADTVNSQQSPIDIVDAATTAGNGGSAIHLFRNYTTTAFKIKARPGGHPGFQMIPLNGVAMFMVDGVRYDLIQFHYHSPSEHTVNGVQYPLEVHFVHQNAAGGLAVFGILYPLEDAAVSQAPNPFLRPFWDEIYYAHDTNLNDTIDFSGMAEDISGSPLYRYPGSLTTPPCSEGVKWHVTVSNTGINAGQKIVYNYALQMIENFRPVQPLHSRTVTKYSLTLPSTNTF